MRVEEALRLVEARGLYVANTGMTSAGTWTCSLRKIGDRPFASTATHTSYVLRGQGKTMAAAIVDAATPKFEDLF